MQPRNGWNLARLKVSFRSVAFLPVALLAATSPAVAQINDITLSLAGIPSQSRSFRSPSAGSVQISPDVSLGANYSYRLLDAEFAAIYGEIQFCGPS
jgi:hypothetical protein